MVRTKFYLDIRKADVTGDVNPLRINIYKNCKTAAFAVGIKLAQKQWNAKTGQVVNHPEAMLLNKMLAQKKVEVDTIILKLADAGSLGDIYIRICHIFCIANGFEWNFRILVQKRGARN